MKNTIQTTENANHMNKEIICPNCGKPIAISGASYAEIVAQVKNKEFDAEINRRLQEIEQNNLLKQDILQKEIEGKYAEQMAAKEQDLIKKEAEITRLLDRVSSIEKSLQNAIDKAVADKDRQIARLTSDLDKKDSEIEIAVMKAEKEAVDKIQEQVDKVNNLTIEMTESKHDAEVQMQELKNQYEIQLKLKDEALDQYKNFKKNLSTKAIGESLEVFCSNKFEEMRTFGAFPEAVFHKDNEVVEGSKGDFIFRDFINGTEYVSIMFEMKNEADATATKHKNSDFFDKLDKDRKKKDCEYAVLVSMLETEDENNVYNRSGIVAIPGYEKMYVIRPQFFMTTIALLCQAAKSSADDKRKLAEVLNQQVDVSKFEAKLGGFTKKFTKNVQQACKNFDDAIAAIDKSIDELQSTKEALLKTESYLNAAQSNLGDVTIKKLTHGNPTMKKKFEEARLAALNEGQIPSNIEMEDGVDADTE
ncbi:MAG: DUF2130 domain-containing protein [Bacteroidales bacterium]|nr:DUF2130 domain-containing protein [Bacteroidales bacterium]